LLEAGELFQVRASISLAEAAVVATYISAPKPTCGE